MEKKFSTRGMTSTIGPAPDTDGIPDLFHLQLVEGGIAAMSDPGALIETMNEWDSAAADRLQHVTAELHRAGVAAVFRRRVPEVWRANLHRHSPLVMGDTTQSLGFVAAVNVAQLAFMDLSSDSAVENSSPERLRTVIASRPGGSLLVEACGARVHVMKAPATPSRVPDWFRFNWSETDSRTRLRAAQRNSNIYLPLHSDQRGREQPLSTPGPTLPLWGSTSGPDGLADVMLVWSGDIESGLTAGWWGFPSLGSVPWFAVTPLWWESEDSLEPFGQAGSWSASPDVSHAVAAGQSLAQMSSTPDTIDLSFPLSTK